MTDPGGDTPDRSDDQPKAHAERDKVVTAPTDAGHSDADTQTERNAEDESPG